MIKMLHERNFARRMFSMLLFAFVLFWYSAAMAAAKGPASGEPKRSYGSIDVILYQTSW
jgi:hypothetical protein